MAYVGGLLGLAALMVFISAIPHSYKVEARSNPERFGSRKFGYTNIWAVALNFGVARDETTQLMRKKVVAKLLIALGLFVLMAVVSAGLGTKT